MIDWWTVGVNALWILGLSIVLAAFSYHNWLARETKRRRRDLLKERSFQLPWTAGMLLVTIGWALAQAVRWWERSFWFALAALFAWEVFRHRLPRRSS